jgi:hypothetical protein
MAAVEQALDNLHVKPGEIKIEWLVAENSNLMDIERNPYSLPDRIALLGELIILLESLIEQESLTEPFSLSINGGADTTTEEIRANVINRDITSLAQLRAYISELKAILGPEFLERQAAHQMASTGRKPVYSAAAPAALPTTGAAAPAGSSTSAAAAPVSPFLPAYSAATAAASGTPNGLLSGAGSITVNGGTLVLSGNNLYSGGTTLSSDVLSATRPK